MKIMLLALAGLVAGQPALAAKPAHPAAKVAKAAASTHRAKSVAPAPSSPEDAALPPLAPQAQRVADWVVATADNQGLPYAIVDKPNASLALFDADGTLRAQVPVLLGIALGDHSTPGVGSKRLAEIGPAEKTTPAGRFLARFGTAAGKHKVLWVDYADSVALHPIPPGASPNEHRRQRLLSPESDDNRITFGCINVPSTFYSKNLRPLFLKQGGYVYVLPDEKPLDEVFPLLRAQPIPQAVK